MRVLPIVPILIAAGIVTGACAGEEEPGADTMGAVAGLTQAAPPDTVADDVWRYMQAQNYREQWALWPGKGRLYKGGDPHGMLLTTYLNPAAMEALSNGAQRMPHGAIIVKENYMADSTLAATTVMYKAPAGYNPDANDWYWIKRNADGTVDAAGRAAMCQSCHGGRADNDYVLTGNLAGR